MNYGKKDMIRLMQQKTGLNRSDCEIAYKAFIDSMFELVVDDGRENEMIVGKTLIMKGFGKFFIKKHKGHPSGFNSKNVKDYYIFRFKPSTKVKADVRDRIKQLNS